MQEHIGVGLLRRAKTAVSLGVGHSTIHHEVSLLYHLKVLNETLVVFGTELLIHVISSRIDRVESVHPYTTLEASGGLLPHEALHLHLLNEVSSVLMDMAETVNSLTRNVAGSRH